MSITPTLTTLGGVTLAHARVLVLGGGVTGRSVAQVLSNMGAEISVYDESESSEFDFHRVTLNEVSNINWSSNYCRSSKSRNSITK
jgi:UDP-N-acetylmuramoylalanine-D-glutamate ligase